MGGFCCSTLMKVFAILLCLFVALAICDDAGNTNVLCTSTQTVDKCGAGPYTAFDLDDWTEVTVSSAAAICFSASYDSDDSEETYFVLAVRPGDDGNNATLPVVTSGVQINGTGAYVAQLCSQVQPNQVDDDFDFNCANVSTIANFPESTGNVTLRVSSPNAANSTVEIYAAFADGSSCNEDLVSSGGSWWWIVIVLIVIVVIIVLVAAVGGFLYMKKKKSSYQLYEDA